MSSTGPATRGKSRSSFNLPPGKGSRKPGAVSEIAAVRSGSDFRDEMISLPGTKSKKRDSNQYSAEKTPRYPDASSRPVQDVPSVVLAGSRPQVIQPQVPEERTPAAGTQAPALKQPSLPPESAMAQRAPRIRPSSPVITETPVQKRPVSTGRAEGASRRPSLTETPAVIPPTKRCTTTCEEITRIRIRRDSPLKTYPGKKQRSGSSTN